MPQLDKLIFLMENLGFVMSFFFMVFYNQYVFYPQLLKNIFVRKFFLINLNLNNLFQNLINFYVVNINFKTINLLNLFEIFDLYFNNYYKKIQYFINLKFKVIRYFLNLMIMKFKYYFIISYGIYHQYIVNSQK